LAQVPRSHVVYPLESVGSCNFGMLVVTWMYLVPAVAMLQTEFALEAGGAELAPVTKAVLKSVTQGGWRPLLSAPSQSQMRTGEMVMSEPPPPPMPGMMPGEPGEGMKINAKETYDMMFDSLLKAQEGDITKEIEKVYAMVDYHFLKELDERIFHAKDEDLAKLKEAKEAINAEMAKRMQQAAEVFKDLVQSPTPVIMEGKIAGLARSGRLDDAVFQLLEANLQQAEAAGEQGKGAVAVLSKLKDRVRIELDKKVPPETALIRELLRMEDSMARINLLKDKMRRKQGGSNIILAGVSKEEEEATKSTEPDVTPKALAAALTELKARFGNVDENYDTGLVKKLNTIAEEAESAALELAEGKEISAKEAQDLAWEKQTVSVWDLGQIEDEAHQDGNFAVWEEEAQQQMARQDSAMREQAIKNDQGS